MPFEERTQPMEQTGHRIILVSRERLTVSGVESFDENAIVMATEDGRLHIRGEELHIEKLSLDGGDLLVRGRVDALTYEEEEEPREGLLRRLLRG